MVTQIMKKYYPMFTNAHFFDFSIDKWIDQYYLIIPTYKGHDSHSTYISTEDEIKSIDAFLQEHHITHLKAVIGFSLGGNIAFQYFCQHKDCIDLLKNISTINIKNVCWRLKNILKK